MCGRFTLTPPDPGALRSRFALDDRIELRRRFNVAPGDDVVALTTDRDGTPRGDVLRWGLVPHWAKDPAALGLKLINARSETVTERPAFRDAFATHRCLILADGFYEWQRGADGRRRPWWIARADGEPFAFAGLWASWHATPGAEPLRTCTILTTAAAPAIADLHDRMPVMLGRSDEPHWLASDTPPAALAELCVPYEATTARAVSTAVNDARHDGPDCLDPPAPEPATLF